MGDHLLSGRCCLQFYSWQQSILDRSNRLPMLVLAAFADIGDGVLASTNIRGVTHRLCGGQCQCLRGKRGLVRAGA